MSARRAQAAMPRPPLSPDDALLDAAADVAWRLCAFDSYRGSRRRALSALKRRRPGFDDDRYRDALDAAIVMFDAARRLVDEHLATWRRTATEPGSWPDAVVESLAARCPGFPRTTYVDLLNGIDLFYHRM